MGDNQHWLQIDPQKGICPSQVDWPGNIKTIFFYLFNNYVVFFYSIYKSLSDSEDFLIWNIIV